MSKTVELQSSTIPILFTVDQDLRVEVEKLNERLILTFAKSICQPVIPKRFKHVTGTTIYTGFVIEDNYGNQFTWVPVNTLAANGTLDGINFTEKFGRRNWFNERFDKTGFSGELNFNEECSGEIKKQHESIKEYGGFYVARYMTSCFENHPKSVKDADVRVDIKFDEAINYAKIMSSENWNNEGVSAHVIYGAEYDSILQWFLDMKVKSCEEIVENSVYCGNYGDNSKNNENKNNSCYDSAIELTGSNKEFEVLNIDGIFGNAWTLTQENCYWDLDKLCTIRGGSFTSFGRMIPPSIRLHHSRSISKDDIGFRMALYID